MQAGEPTTEQRDIRLSIRPLRTQFGDTIAADVKPSQLKATREAMIDSGLCRNEVNKRFRRLVRMFAWGVEEGLIPSPVYWALKSIKSLAQGRGVRESEPIRPVDDEVVDATLPHLAPRIRAMVAVQRLAGMRPGEVTLMRTGDIDRSGAVWTYVPARHKTQHHGKTRVIHLGPQAQEVVKPWLRADATAYLFCPREALAESRAEQRTRRKTPMTPSQRARKPKARPKRAPREHYDTRSYYHAVLRGVLKANAAAKRAAVASGTDPIEIPAWHPNQLRHNAGTKIRKAFGLDTARATLGHSSATTTEIYAELDHTKAADAMAKIG